MRLIMTLLHRWVGLTIAAFLFIAGFTGAIISWDHELDELLNPHLTESTTEGPHISALELARQVEARDPRARVTYLPLAAEPGHSLSMFVEPRVDPKTSQLYELGYNQVFLDPVTGTVLGKREWGQAWPITTETLISFLYKLHYSLHIPEMWGTDTWGLWLMGGIAILWMVDCFVGFYLTLPPRSAAPRAARALANRKPVSLPTVTRARAGRFHPLAPRVPARNGSLSKFLRLENKTFWQRWKPAWLIKASGSAYRINFDVHRAFGLWTWAMLFMLAFTAFSLNLYREIFYPLMSMVSQVTPTPYDVRTPTPLNEPIEPKIGYAELIEKARAEAGPRGWTEPVGAVGYSPEYGVLSARFFYPGGDHGAAGVGPPELYFDGTDGRYLGDRQPWVGTAADIFVQAQFPLHSGRILGIPGRILISIMGIVVAVLSITGVVIWAKKRSARVASRQRGAGAPVATADPFPAE